MTYARNRRDKAEPRYLKVYADSGATWIPLILAGCDGLLLCNGNVAIVEHKTGTHWQLTDDEQQLRSKCLQQRVPYHVVDSEIVARALVGDLKGERVIEPLPFSDYRVAREARASVALDHDGECVTS